MRYKSKSWNVQYSAEYKAFVPSPKYSKHSITLRNLLYRRGTTLLCSAGNHVVGDRGSMFRTRMYKQSLSVGIRVQPMTITIEELQFQGRVESYIIWAVPALVIPSCVGTMWNMMEVHIKRNLKSNLRRSNSNSSYILGFLCNP